MDEVLHFLNFWPLNTSWYVPVVIAVFVAVVLLHIVAGAVRSHAERRSRSLNLSTSEIRKLRGNGH